MKLNTLSPAPGARKTGKRVGRGMGSGKGKTCGRGHKGQKSRAGGKVRVGFEGGQMPLYRRLAKFGFTSRKKHLTQEMSLEAIARIEGVSEINLEVLKALDLIKHSIENVKIFGDAEITRPLVISGLRVSEGAKRLIEAAGGSIQ